MAAAHADTSRLLAEMSASEPLPEALVELLYDELRRIAHGQLKHERPDHTLTTTALVHEAWLRLAGSTHLPRDTHARFLAAAANTMRRVLVDYARARNTKRREGMRHAVALDEALDLAKEQGEELLALDDALARLQASAPRLVQIVECRFFAGLSEAETAEVMGTSVRTVRRDWVKAKGWLAAAMG